MTHFKGSITLQTSKTLAFIELMMCILCTFIATNPKPPACIVQIVLTSNRCTKKGLGFFMKLKQILCFLLAQKGFLSGVNKNVEHIFSICSILDNAVQHKKPLEILFWI